MDKLDKLKKDGKPLVEGEQLKADDLDKIDLAVPWELPIKRKVLDDLQYEKKLVELKRKELEIKKEMEIEDEVGSIDQDLNQSQFD